MKPLLLLSLAAACLLQPAMADDDIKFQNTLPINEGDSQELIIKKAAHIVPTPNQLAALRNEFIAFIHIGPNTFTRKEWGNGKEDPKIFDLKNLNTDQWCQAIKSAGMKMVILTTKHHDGFVLWQSRYTKHGIMSTNFRNGKGDILRDLSKSCHKYGLKLGVYLSPADLYQIENPEGLYGNLSKTTKRTIPRPVPGRPFKNKTTFQFEVDDYNEYFLNQLFEILTEYGPVHEVWFDGAHPKTKGGQKYNYAAWRQLIRTLAPEAVIFGKEDLRWCGNESGKTRKTEWNVIPLTSDPNVSDNFPDMTGNDLGSRERLYKAKFLHYQQAETNTSIREGWFYRDDVHQKVRSADDVFDIYERSVGGNSTFLLNMPPNRDGVFSPIDVNVLKETGKRIRATYGVNLLESATGPKPVLDNNPDTYISLEKDPKEIVLTTPTPITLNRLVLQEAIQTRGERIEEHAVDAWVDNNWQEISRSTNVGYKRILRFPEVTTTKIRVRILQSRLDPSISHISAHYYTPRPPQIAITRDSQGMVTLSPVKQEFNWKPHGQNTTKNLHDGFEIYYTTNGSAPDEQATKYTEPFFLESGNLKAVAILKGQKGALLQEKVGYPKKDWQLILADSAADQHPATAAFDSNPSTYWMSSESNDTHHIDIDLGSPRKLTGFAYTPQKQNSAGMMAKGVIKTSNDGKTWKKHDSFEFGNLINDPEKRYHFFKKAITSRYVRIEASEIAGKEKMVTVAELDLF